MSEKMTSQNDLNEIKSVPYNKPQNLAVHCSATVLREQNCSKKRHLTTLHAGQTACRTISSSLGKKSDASSDMS